MQMSDYLSPLWNTYLTKEVQLKLFLENYLCGSGCAPVFTFSRSGSAVNLHTLSSASEYIRAAFCMNSEVSPLTKLGRLSGRAEGTFCILFFFYHHRLDWNQQQPACFGWFSLLCDCSPSENKNRVLILTERHRNLGEKLAVLLSLNNTETG